MWAVVFVAVTIFMMTLSAEALADPTPGLIAQRILVGIPFELGGPAAIRGSRPEVDCEGLGIFRGPGRPSL